MKELFNIQQRLVSNKVNFNEFNKFNYRNLEGILADVKPLLNEYKCTITFTDDMVLLGDRYYVKSTVTLTNENNEKVNAVAFAREDLTRAGMSESQVTGTASSYARKYAICSLLAINEEQDPDSLDNRRSFKSATAVVPKVQPSKFQTYNNNHIVPQNDADALGWTPEEERQPVAVIQPTQQEKAPAEQLKEWFETQNQNDPIISKFYTYWYKRLVEQGWKGKFDLNGLITKFCK